MKKVISTLALAMLLSGITMTGCRSSATKVENATDKVDKAQAQVELAQQELDLAIRDSIQQFKKESEEKIIVNEQNIAEYKARIAKETNDTRGRDERRLAEMEKQNREMKQQLGDFDENRRDQWLSFRAKFNHDMEAQRRAFRDFWGIRK